MKMRTAEERAMAAERGAVMQVEREGLADAKRFEKARAINLWSLRAAHCGVTT